MSATLELLIAIVTGFPDAQNHVMDNDQLFELLKREMGHLRGCERVLTHTFKHNEVLRDKISSEELQEMLDIALTQNQPQRLRFLSSVVDVSGASEASERHSNVLVLHLQNYMPALVGPGTSQLRIAPRGPDLNKGTDTIMSVMRRVRDEGWVDENDPIMFQVELLNLVGRLCRAMESPEVRRIATEVLDLANCVKLVIHKVS